MSNSHQDGRNEDRSTDLLTNAVTMLAHELKLIREHVPLATKADLDSTERRLLAAINVPMISTADQNVLNGLLARSEREAVKLEALDGKTPPPVTTPAP